MMYCLLVFGEMQVIGLDWLLIGRCDFQIFLLFVVLKVCRQKFWVLVKNSSLDCVVSDVLRVGMLIGIGMCICMFSGLVFFMVLIGICYISFLVFRFIVNMVLNGGFWYGMFSGDRKCLCIVLNGVFFIGMMFILILLVFFVIFVCGIIQLVRFRCILLINIRLLFGFSEILFQFMLLSEFGNCRE